MRETFCFLFLIPLQAEILSNLSITLRSTKLSSTARTCNSGEEEEEEREEDKSPTAIIFSWESERTQRKRLKIQRQSTQKSMLRGRRGVT